MRPLLFATILTASLAGMVSAGGGSPTPTTPAPAESHEEHGGMTPEMMAAMQKAASPGPEHEVLMKWTGKFNCTMRAWFVPGQPATESTATAEVTAILGGRYFLERFTGTFMNQPFEGTGLFGYDNIRKEHVTAWADTAGTQMMVTRGIRDSEGKKITSVGSLNDPQTGKASRVRTTVEFKDDKTMVYTLYETPPGESEKKDLEVTYVRP